MDVQNYLELSEKLKRPSFGRPENDLLASEENQEKLKKQAENKEALYSSQLTEQEKQIAKLEKQKGASKDLIFNLRKEIRENQLEAAPPP